MNRILGILTLYILAWSYCMSQELAIKSFSLDASDKTASIHKRLDANGDPCALVKVQLLRPNATFNGNVVGDVSYLQSEYLVYLTKGSKRLQVKLDGYLPLDIYFAEHGVQSLLELSTYKLQLVMQNPSSAQHQFIQKPKGCPDNHHPHAIDLGLPSGIKWACCNVNATKPEEHGSYFAWGETMEKSHYNWKNYIYGNSVDNCQNIGNNIAGTKYDVARMKWGGEWRMPSLEQTEELIDNCIIEWSTMEGVKGMKLTGPNGESIFLPAAGTYGVEGLDGVGTHGYFWSSSLNPYGENDAYYFSFYPDGWNEYDDNDGRCSGQSVRPVCH